MAHSVSTRLASATRPVAASVVTSALYGRSRGSSAHRRPSRSTGSSRAAPFASPPNSVRMSVSFTSDSSSDAVSVFVRKIPRRSSSMARAESSFPAATSALRNASEAWSFPADVWAAVRRADATARVLSTSRVAKVSSWRMRRTIAFDDPASES